MITTVTKPDFRQVAKIAALILTFLLTLAVLYISRMTVLTILVGIGLGVILSPVLKYMTRKFKISRGISAVLITLLLFLFLGGLAFGFYLIAKGQVEGFKSQLPELTEKAQHLVGRYVPQFQELDFAEYAQKITAGAFLTLKTLLIGAAGLLLVVTVSIFTALRSKEYLEGVMTAFPNYLQPRYQETAKQIAHALRTWFKSQVVVVLITGSMVSAGLMILGIPFWLVLGALTGLAGFIPFVGAFISGATTALVTLGSAPEKIWWVIGLYFLVQQIENHVTLPMVMRKESQLPEVPLILFMLVLGQIFGVIGAIIAAPLLAIVRILYWRHYVPRMKKLTPPDLELGVVN